MSPSAATEPISRQHLEAWAHAGRKFAMLTAYDYPLAAAAAAAGIETLLIGDSLGSVVLGHDNTRAVPLELMLMLGAAVRRGAPNAYLVGDIPYEAVTAGEAAVVTAARRYRDEVGCQAVKLETGAEQMAWLPALQAAAIDVIAHLGLRPQSVTQPTDYRAQARDTDSIAELAQSAKQAVAAGARLVLLEAVPPEASAAVVAAVDVPVIGCGAGPACHGFVVVTHDLLGLGAPRPPRFVPVLADLRGTITTAMRTWGEQIRSGVYPAPEHNYGLRRDAST